MDSEYNYEIKNILQSQERILMKWNNYLEQYDNFFKKLKYKDEINILEIGVYHGGGLEFLKKYFSGCKVNLFGVDIAENCKVFNDDNTKIFIGNQSNPVFLKYLCENTPPLDIVIDDGGHRMEEQIFSFNFLFSHLAPGGVYLCEDTHTSYMKEYGGSLHKSENTFIEFTKNLIDQMHGYRTNNITYITLWCKSINIYESMVFFQKSLIELKPTVSIHYGKKDLNTSVLEYLKLKN